MDYIQSLEHIVSLALHELDMMNEHGITDIAAYEDRLCAIGSELEAALIEHRLKYLTVGPGSGQ